LPYLKKCQKPSSWRSLTSTDGYGRRETTRHVC
jgi:hypothetical protein